MTMKSRLHREWQLSWLSHNPRIQSHSTAKKEKLEEHAEKLESRIKDLTDKQTES